jgi:hypothetical protein
MAGAGDLGEAGEAQTLGDAGEGAQGQDEVGHLHIPRTTDRRIITIVTEIA